MSALFLACLPLSVVIRREEIQHQAIDDAALPPREPRVRRERSSVTRLRCGGGFRIVRKRIGVN